MGPIPTHAAAEDSRIMWGRQDTRAGCPGCPCYRADMPVLEAISVSSMGKMITAFKVMGRIWPLNVDRAY